MMELIISSTLFGVFIILSYTLGLKNGHKLSNNKSINMPSLNIPKKIREYKNSKEEQKEQERLETILQNIERYDGSEIGQEVVK